MEEIKVADTARYVSFYAYQSSDHISPATGITGFTVYYYLNNGSAAAMTTPTVAEKDATNMPGWYTLAVDEAGMVAAGGITSIDITASGIDPVPIKVLIIGNTTKEAYDILNNGTYGLAHLIRSTTPANTLDVSATGVADANMIQCGGSTVAAGAIPNAAADAAGGLPVSDNGGLDLDTKLANTNEITFARMGALTDWINGGRLDLLLDGLHSTPHCATGGTINNGSTVSGSYTDTCVDDSNYWRLTYSGSTIDFQLEFEVGANRISTYVTMELASAPSSYTVIIYAYNYLSNSWDQINYDALMSSNTSLKRFEFSLLQDHVNPYYNDDGGDVLIRVLSTGHGIGSYLEISFCNVHTIDASLATNGKQLSAFGKLDVNAECDSALSDYDSPTRTEATSDKDAIITEVDANETKIDSLQTDSTAIKAKTDNLPSGIAKNTAISAFAVFMVLASDSTTPATGKTVTCTISKDGGSFGASTNSVAEISNGAYKIDLIAAELNADIVILRFTAAACNDRIITIYTS